jgi:protein ImuB
MLWSALLLPCPDAASPPTDAARQALAVWALQFSPRVAVADEAVLIEVAGSLRLFGGRRALAERLWAEGQQLGVQRIAWAPNSLAALALARAGANQPARSVSLQAVLDALPISVLSAVRPHATTLAHIGCRTLGNLRALPRGGIARRFDQALLRALDQVYGLAPEVHPWVELPEVFDARLELMHRVEDASALLFGAQRLLLQLCGWLAARHSGTTAFTLHWAHDAMRSRDAGEGGQLTIRTAQPTRDIEHLTRLLAEHLAQVTLEAPVGDLRLSADEVRALTEASHSFLPDTVDQGEALHRVLERLAARLGPARVLRPVLQADHRPEWMCRWQAAPLALPRQSAPRAEGPQPSFLLPTPLKLALRGHRPIYQGELQLLAGPQRIEGGWWDRVAGASGDEERTRNVVRDYWVALSEHAGVLWVFQTRLDESPAWYLHGHFA